MEKIKEINNARAIKNGIIFFSNKFPLIGLKMFFDDSENIQNKIIFTDTEDFIEYLTENSKIKKWPFIVFAMALIIFSIILFAFTKRISFILAALYFAGFASFDLLVIAKTSYNMKSKNGKQLSTARFHAAEHMVVNAYETLQRIPTLEEVKKFSRFSKKCGSNKLLSRIFIYSMISIAMCFSGYNSLVYLLLLLLIFLFILLAKKYGWLFFLQVFVTAKPSDKELNLAIEGLKQFEIMEERLDNEEDLSTMIDLPDTFPFIIPFPFNLKN